MSEFFKRWSARKREAQQTVPIEIDSNDQNAAIPLPEAETGEVTDPVNASLLGEANAEKAGGDEPSSLVAVPVPTSPLTAASAQGEKAKPALPDRETLRAMFRSHKPDGLDDYTQDFSKPELLSAALTAGLRNWLVDAVLADDGEPTQTTKGEVKGEADAEAGIMAEANATSESLPCAVEGPVLDRDILALDQGQNVPSESEGMASQGS